MRWLSRIVIASIVVLTSAVSAASAQLPRSVLILDQSDTDSAWYEAFSSAFRLTLNARPAVRVSVYAEHLDLSRFGGPRHDELLRAYLRDKFSERPIGVVVAQGSSALEFVVRARAELWPQAPVVFAGVDEATAARLSLPRDVTGTTYQLTFRDAVTSAKSLVPGLKRIALVGDPFERQAVRSHFKAEVPAVAAELELIDLMGLPMAELRRRVAALPADTAIIYTAINIDGAGVAYVPHEALAALADVANRPIVIDAETSIGHGGAGGLIVSAGPVAEEAARRVLRILDGEPAASIPISKGSFARPIFDWRQLQRFAIDERSLPPGSDIRFRPPGMWAQYRWQIIVTAVVLMVQAATILGLLFERSRRRAAELESRRRILEVIHLNRTATAGALSASIAHELYQPLGAILINVKAAEVLLGGKPPDLAQIREILADIRRDDQRAGDVIKHLRGLLRKGEIEMRECDLNDVVRDALDVLEPEALMRGVELSVDQVQGTVPVRADQIHLQQVILNLATNGMDAMSACAPGMRRMTLETRLVRESEV